LNAHHFLKNNGHVVISIKATCIDSTAPAEVVYASEVKKMQEEMIKPHEQLTLEPYERDQYVFLTVLDCIATLRVGADLGGVLQRDGRRLVPPPQGLGRQKAQCIGHGSACLCFCCGVLLLVPHFVSSLHLIVTPSSHTPESGGGSP
jgi:hypothetical protein